MSQKTFKDVIKDNESLKIFLQKMREFDQKFVVAMTEGEDFTLRLEVRGNQNQVLHVRTYSEGIARPSSAGKNKR